MRLIRFIILFVLFLSSYTLNAQQINTLYFMENVPVRHVLNPAFHPTTQLYLSLPVIGFTQLYTGNNSLALKDVIYNYEGQTITFLNQNGDINRFYDKLHTNTVINAGLQTNLLAFGFKANKTYWNFGISEKLDAGISLPKSLFQLTLYGTPDSLSNFYNFYKFNSDISVYTEFAFGFSTPVTDKLTIGGKMKFLYGTTNFSNRNDQLNLHAGIADWNFVGSGSTNEAGPVQVNVSTNLQNATTMLPTTLNKWFTPFGLGAGIDFGADYKLNENIRVSAAITDLGFIHWYKNARNVNYSANYTFNGIAGITSDMSLSTIEQIYNKLITGNNLADSLINAVQSASQFSASKNAYNTATSANLNLGFEYNVLHDKLGFGLLSNSRFFRETVTEEIALSVNARPYEWLNATLSYSLLKGNFSTIGAGLGLRTGILNWFISMDYIPFYKSTLTLSDLSSSYPPTKIPIPYTSKTFNFAIGINLVFDKKNSDNEQINQSGSASGTNNTKLNTKKRGRSVNSRGLINSRSVNDCNCE